MTNLIHTCFILQHVYYNPLQYMLIIRSLNCIDAASGIVLLVSGHSVHRLEVLSQPVHSGDDEDSGFPRCCTVPTGQYLPTCLRSVVPSSSEPSSRRKASLITKRKYYTPLECWLTFRHRASSI